MLRSDHAAGLRDLTVVSDKARLAQKGLYEVDGLLHTIARALANSHPPESQSGPQHTVQTVSGRPPLYGTLSVHI